MSVIRLQFLYWYFIQIAFYGAQVLSVKRPPVYDTGIRASLTAQLTKLVTECNILSRIINWTRYYAPASQTELMAPYGEISCFIHLLNTGTSQPISQRCPQAFKFGFVKPTLQHNRDLLAHQISQSVRRFDIFTFAIVPLWKSYRLKKNFQKSNMYFLFFFPSNTELQQEEPKENSFLSFLQVLWVKKTISNKKVYFIIKKSQKSADFSPKNEILNSLIEILFVILDNSAFI